MGKSNETFNKKEKEKKRLKKQQEKKEKAEIRKASAGKGKGLNDMMAYVDENGNITSTPPTGLKQNPVLAEDILIATPKRIYDPEEDIKDGVISFFNNAKGYGFIRDKNTRENIFFHVNSLKFQAKENDKVNFATEKGFKGMNAVNITKAK